MGDYRKALGVHGGREVGRYSHWTAEDYSRYAAEVARRLPESRKLERADLDAMYIAGRGPNLHYIEDHGYTIGMMNEFIGYPDIRNWEEDDYVHWGVRVMEANEGIISARMMDVLSKHDRGPSSTTISRNFGNSLRPFYKLVRELRQEQQKKEVAKKQKLLRDYAELRKLDLISSDFDTAGESMQLTVAARYALAKECLPYSATEVHAQVARDINTALKSSIRSRRGTVTPGRIEMEASVLEVYDLLWPSCAYMRYLRVPEKELLKGLRKEAAGKRAREAAKR